MNFEHSDKVKDLLARVSKFMDDNIYPAESVYAEHMGITKFGKARPFSM